MDRAPYDDIADDFSKLRTHLFPKEKEYIDKMLERASREHAVLDLGCGMGRPIASYVESLGYKIVGVDASAKLLQKAKEAMPEQSWILAKLEEIDFTQKFAAVLCWDSLFHLPREMHKAIFAKIHRFLLPKGRLMVSSGGNVGTEGFTDQMFGHNFYYDSLPQGELFETLDEVGFKVLWSELFDLPDSERNKGKRGTLAEKLQ